MRSKCVVCEMRRNTNRYGLCDACASDYESIDVGLVPDAQSLFSVSQNLQDFPKEEIFDLYGEKLAIQSD